MEKVGVAVEGDGCKLLITTRKRDVCRKMSCGTIVEMKPLLQNEAWDLFVSKLGNYESLNDATKCVARSIAQECAGLPLAIVTMASSMRGECDVHEWRYVLRQMQNPCSNHNDMDNKVFNILKLSYERLSNDKLRQCLLYCALYCHDIRMPIKDFIAVALLRNEGTRNENRDEGHHMLKALADASLLEYTEANEGTRKENMDEGYNVRMLIATADFDLQEYMKVGYHGWCIKMHDLIKDMAVKIMGSKGIAKPGKGLKKMPQKEEWTQDLELGSLMGNYIEDNDIGDELCPECPNMLVLILSGNPLRNISHSFFVHMKGLRCLDLSYTSIVNLPVSISNLCNLDALLLEFCKNLAFIPSVAKITKLRELNLCGTRVEALPEGVKELISLKYLHIARTRIRSIPEGLFSKLCKLESFFSNEAIKIVYKELTSLRKLLSFEGRVDDFAAFQQFVNLDWFDQLERYSIVFGDYGSGYPMYWLDNTCDLATRLRRISIVGTELAFKIPHNIQFLELQGCSFRAECLLEALPSLCAATELEKCLLAYCKGIKYIISMTGFVRGEYHVSTPIKGVQRLDLMELDDFVGLYEGEAVHPHIFFAGLRELNIFGCPSVKRIWLQNDILPNLESIYVIDCKSMEEIIATADETTKIKWPKLSSLNLEKLPELKRICGNTVFFPQLQHLRAWRCPMLKNLGLLNHNMPSLRGIRIVECRGMEEIFERKDGAVDDDIHLPNLERITLKELPELRSICMEEIIATTDETKTTIKWPKLSSLKLKRLPELKRICRNTVFFPQIQHLQISECPKLKNLGLLNHDMPSLKEIRIVECRGMEEIFERRDGAVDGDIDLPNLERITLQELPELRSICGNGISVVCDSLQSVTVKGENKLENCPISVPRLLTSSTSPPFPTLQAMDKPKDWWNSLCWNDPNTKLAFNRLGCISLHQMQVRFRDPIQVCYRNTTEVRYSS